MNIQEYVNSQKANLDARELAVIQTDLNKGKPVSWVTPEQEGQLFAWYMLGRSSKDIAEMSGYPESVIILTALRYEWGTKKASIVASGSPPTDSLARDTMNQIFGLIMMSVQADVRDVMQGKKDPRQSIYIPKNATQLKDFLETLQSVNNEENIAKPPPHVATTVVVVTGSEAKQVPQQSNLAILKNLARENSDESTVS